MEKKAVIGALMIFLGIVWALINSQVIEGDIFLLLVSFVFFVVYLSSGRDGRKGPLGFLITACLTLAVGMFSILEDNLSLHDLDGPIFFLFVGTAFLMVYLVHTRELSMGGYGSRKWPLVTAACIYTFAVFLFLLETLKWKFVASIFNYIWPAALIAAGAAILLRELIPRKKDLNK